MRRFAPDFGSKLSRLGLLSETVISLYATRLDTVGRVSDQLMTASSNCEFCGEVHCASFDFAPKFLAPILAGLPTKLADAFSDALSRAPFYAVADLAIEVDLSTHLGSETQGKSELFLPLVIDEVNGARFNPISATKEERTDVPPGIFRLGKAFEIRNVKRS